jgi:glycosyltransferase involved in cell wall biosynthesis
MKKYFHVIAYPIRVLLDGLMFFPLIILSLVSRFFQKKIDIGIGPEPIIGHKYQKKALQMYGYSVETYVNSVYFLTKDFDIRGDLYLPKYGTLLLPYLLFMVVIFRYKCIYIYFNGGSLFPTIFLWRAEPLLYKISKVQVVVMPYGGDVQELSRSNNLMYKAAVSKDYPAFRFRRKKIETRIDMWTKYANHVISGCDWVEYMYHWDTLVLAHFTIDEEQWKPGENTIGKSSRSNSLKIFHAPNHKSIKGTKYFVSAIESLRRDGFDIELIILQKVPNERIKEMILAADIVADQLIIGWYGMFAVEAMAMGKPVLCYIRPDFEDFFINEGLLEPDELPIIKCTHRNLKQKLIDLIQNKQRLDLIGDKSREFVMKHHSTKSMGKIFDHINRSVGIRPSGN